VIFLDCFYQTLAAQNETHSTPILLPPPPEKAPDNTRPHPPTSTPQTPSNRRVRSAGRFPIFVESAQGAHFRDVDGHRFIDFCLGDTGAMAGHGAAASVKVCVGVCGCGCGCGYV